MTGVKLHPHTRLHLQKKASYPALSSRNKRRQRPLNQHHRTAVILIEEYIHSQTPYPLNKATLPAINPVHFSAHVDVTLRHSRRQMCPA